MENYQLCKANFLGVKGSVIGKWDKWLAGISFFLEKEKTQTIRGKTKMTGKKV